MIKLRKPTLDLATVFGDCTDGVGDVGLKSRLKACAQLVKDAETEFEQKVDAVQVHTIAQEAVVNGNVPKEEFKKLYDRQFVQSSKGRVYYDQLKLSSPGNLCPLCGHREVSTLDHFLPKALYPRLSVVPINLVPACKDCNTDKRAAFPTIPEEQTLHPYYDVISNVNWLKVRVNHTSRVTVTYFVDKPSSWDNLLFQRVSTHFSSYGLGILYAVQAGRELSGLKMQLMSMLNSRKGPRGVQKFLSNIAQSRRADNLNSWQAALYQGVSEDTWFCSGGLRNIASS